MELQRNKYIAATFLEDNLERYINIENVCYPLTQELHFKGFPIETHAYE